MKSKFTKQPEQEIEEDDADVESGGPSIAAAKKSKVAIIAASSILITVVLYFLFFKGDSKQEKLVEVAPPKPAAVAQSEDGKSPFALEEVKEKKEDLAIVEKPAVPEAPSLPDLPQDSIPQDLIPAEPVVIAPADPVAPASPNQKPADPIAAQNQAPAVEKPKEANPRYAPIIVFGGTAQGTPARGVGYDNNIVNLNEDPIEGLEDTKAGVTATYIRDRLHTIAQGKLLTAVLETAINTEIPGSVRAVVSRDVYGEAGNEVLIPRGSRLFGSYSSKVNQGQGRVEISWSRLIRPDGVDLSISFNASDQFGRSGIPGEVDSKYGSIIASSMLTSILAVGGVAAAQKLLTNNAATTTTTNPTQGTTTTTGSATNQALYDVSKTIIDTVGQVIGNTINVSPVIRIPQGTRITVIVNADITVPSQKNR
ncbi:MAG: hypothetical protein KA100_04910 [Rickettsiales bacterium]|nr:hypothetical protein [Rickettsiales bacterium]